ncbi:MAG: polysaccharide deacetylase family protein [Actinobacteria bacterium]|nr:polysaccharide deacetylase family protein [Actinomycetota bacterium]
MDRRRFMTGFGLLAIGGAAGAGVGFEAEPAIATEGPTARTATPTGTAAHAATVTFRTAPAGKIMALTIDDGPTREWTPQVHRLLARHHAKATFFVVGKRAQADAGAIAAAVDAGHELANHTWDHKDLTQHAQAYDQESLEQTHELLIKLTGKAPTLCRPPYGRIDSVGLACCTALQYDVLLWSNHITGSNATYDTTKVLSEVSPGSIVLAHDGGPEPNANLMKQLDRLVGSLKDDGYQLVTASELLAAAPRA